MAEEERAIEKISPGRWHRDGQIYFCDGNAWGIKKIGSGEVRELKTVCLGEERNVLERLKDTTEKIDKLT